MPVGPRDRTADPKVTRAPCPTPAPSLALLLSAHPRGLRRRLRRRRVGDGVRPPRSTPSRSRARSARQPEVTLDGELAGRRDRDRGRHRGRRRGGRRRATACSPTSGSATASPRRRPSAPTTTPGAAAAHRRRADAQPGLPRGPSRARRSAPASPWPPPPETAFGEAGNAQLGIGNKDTVLVGRSTCVTAVARRPGGQGAGRPAWAPALQGDEEAPTGLDFAGTPEADRQAPVGRP